ncbi:hypothetical protein [Kineococcus aurantiacus]|uniref:Uncharacterized protein n=1 Tax=Kineococcus aurantiacus TaxID=37633 RepID=A0A7Y9ASN0_9ACTN|nr:hypothetical protein [Kineococcus aurantiacus]NYD21004.1 hypothetical protein [Kineococcus aurantiacus]
MRDLAAEGVSEGPTGRGPGVARRGGPTGRAGTCADDATTEPFPGLLQEDVPDRRRSRGPGGTTAATGGRRADRVGGEVRANSDAS